MRIEAIAWFDMPDKGKWHGQNVMPQQELIRCKDCKYYEVGQNKVDAWSACYVHVGRIIETWDDNFCGWAERREDDRNNDI